MSKTRARKLYVQNAKELEAVESRLPIQRLPDASYEAIHARSCRRLLLTSLSYHDNRYLYAEANARIT